MSCCYYQTYKTRRQHNERQSNFLGFTFLLPTKPKLYWYNQQDGGLPEKQRLSESTQPAPEGLLASGQGKQKLAIRSIFEYTEEAQMAPSFLSKMARHLPWWHVFLLDDGLTLLDTYRYSSHWKNTRAMILYRDDRSNVTQIPVRIIYVNQFSQDHP